MTEAVDTVWPQRPDHQGDILMVALRAAGLGVAVLNPAGVLLSGDETFLDLHGIDAAVAGTFPNREQATTLPALLDSAACRLPDADAQALAAAWAELLSSAAEEDPRRSVVALAGGQAVALGIARTGDGGLVLTVGTGDSGDKDTFGAQGRLIHDMNNVVGGMLANLYLCLADLPAGHSVRTRLETINRSTVELRELVRQLAGPGYRSG